MATRFEFISKSMATAEMAVKRVWIWTHCNWRNMWSHYDRLFFNWRPYSIIYHWLDDARYRMRRTLSNKGFCSYSRIGDFLGSACNAVSLDISGTQSRIDLKGSSYTQYDSKYVFSSLYCTMWQVNYSYWHLFSSWRLKLTWIHSWMHVVSQTNVYSFASAKLRLLFRSHVFNRLLLCGVWQQGQASV